jgi:two-component system phosphate regulon sensor histidine kinase PhoR
MHWVLTWVLALVAAVLVGGLAGAILGGQWNHAIDGAVLGAALGAGLVAFSHAMRAHRFVRWLVGAEGQLARVGSGYWAELSYRVERRSKAFEREVAQERSRLEQFLSAIEASPNGVLMLDANDQIHWFNSVAADHFGLSRQRDIQQHITNLLRAPVFVQYMQAAQFDHAIVMPGARPRTALSVLVRPYGEGLKLLLSQDITESERHEAMRRDFVANVSHEIRTPLTVLAGFIETMSSLPLTAVESRRVLELMGQQTSRMQMLVADLLTLAQLEGSPRPASDRWLAVGPLTQRVLDDGRALSNGRHVLEVSDGPGVELAGAENEILSAMANLVNNAVRYTPSGGRVEIQWRMRANGCAEFEVRDTGPGIAREHIPRLTERFYRVDGSRSRDTGGTGLGLSIVKHVVQRHGGELEIQSEIDKGSVFRLVFPEARVRVL